MDQMNLGSSGVGVGASTTTTSFSSSSWAPETPVENNQQQQHNLPAHILQLLRSGSGGAVAFTLSSNSANVSQMPKPSSSNSTPASPTNAPSDHHHHLQQQQLHQLGGESANPLSLLLTAEALESFAS